MGFSFSATTSCASHGRPSPATKLWSAVGRAKPFATSGSQTDLAIRVPTNATISRSTALDAGLAMVGGSKGRRRESTAFEAALGSAMSTIISPAAYASRQTC